MRRFYNIEEYTIALNEIRYIKYLDLGDNQIEATIYFKDGDSGIFVVMTKEETENFRKHLIDL